MTDKAALIARNLIQIPLVFENSGKSASTLVLESGYLESPDVVTVEVLTTTLKEIPEAVEAWLDWSDNKRTNAGWYFNRGGPRGYVLGYYPPSKNLPLTKYPDAYDGCANFIKREVEDIRRLTF
ncbi:MAG: hypothetical protein ABI999_17000 [Acidobacteriota bacterium]